CVRDGYGGGLDNW
nr:immunoglobulin heavy chain junction region [Macaca mulatta]